MADSLPQVTVPLIPPRRLCVVCARGGSRGVPGKNIRPLAGRPLIAYAVEQAIASECFDALAVSSDNPKILDVAARLGVDLLVRRPAELATDAAPKLPAIRHCVLEAETACNFSFDVVVDLAVTSPFRSPADVAGAVRLLEKSDAGNVVSVGAARSSPYYQIVELDDGRPRRSKQPPLPIFRRQDAPPCYELNGAVLAWRREALFRNVNGTLHDDTLAFVMPMERCLDIDDELDFRFAEFLMQTS